MWDTFLNHLVYCNLSEEDCIRGRVAEWSGALVSPAICRLRVQLPSPVGHATLPTTGASVTALCDTCMVVTEFTNILGYGRNLATTLTRPKTPIIIIIINTLHAINLKHPDKKKTR